MAILFLVTGFDKMIFCDSTSTEAHHRLLVSKAFLRSIKIPIESQIKIILIIVISLFRKG